MKRFYLQRNTDASGVSGTGRVAEGCQHDNGWCSLVWLSDTLVCAFYQNIDCIEKIHGHAGLTKVVWVDGESTNFVVK